jgi:hypothetical protein
VIAQVDIFFLKIHDLNDENIDDKKKSKVAENCFETKN